METKDMGRVLELKSALRGKLEAMGRIKDNGIKIEDNGGVVVSGEARDDFRKLLGEANEIKALIAEEEGFLELKDWSEAPAGSAPAGSVSAAAAAAASLMQQGFAPVMERKTIAELFTESDEFKSLLRSGSATMAAPWTIEAPDLGRMGTKDVFTASAPVQSTLGFGRTQFDPMVPREYRRSRVRDLFPVVQTSANLIDYFRVLGFTANRLDTSSSAAAVPERSGNAFALKPQSGLRFESDQAPVRTIAHYEVAHRNVLQDEPALQGTINNELLYGLRLEEDRQILDGDGTGENLLGILNVANIQTPAQSAVAGDTALDAMRRAATLAILAYYEPTGYVVNPLDWEGVELSKDNQERYILATNVAIGAEARVWRQPVVETPAMPQKTVLTGAWGLGAQLYDRMIANIRIAEQHADFFIRNAVAILAEERLALAVKRPESFVKLTLT